MARPPDVVQSNVIFGTDEYWNGLQAEMPGGGEMLSTLASVPKPGTGGPYPWTTASRTHFSCLSSIKNTDGSGQGFLAITVDGTKYWFDWMAQYSEPPIEKPKPSGGTLTLGRRKNVLYATRVEDRFGNWVTYTYTNSKGNPAALTEVKSNDGRRITLGYNAHGHVSSLNDGSHTWTYDYSYPADGRATLIRVNQPDGSKWSISFAAFSNLEMLYNPNKLPDEPSRSCFYAGNLVDNLPASGTITHPAGAVGTFTVMIKGHGRSNVPAVCRGYTTPGNDPNDDFAYYPINWDAFTLTTKQVSGPGVPVDTWNYGYESAVSWFLHPSGAGKPVCQDNINGCGAPVCTDDSCAGSAVTTVTAPDGSWTRYTFGNSYRYNEGKLLRTQRGSGSTPLYTERLAYVLDPTGQPFVTPLGHSPQERGNGFTSESIRPQRLREIVQDGALFVNEVEAFDAFARPIRVRKGSTGTGGFHSDPPSVFPALSAPATSYSGTYALSWTSSQDATRYPLERRINGGSWATVQDTSALSWNASGQAAGTYDYRIRACNTAGCTAYSGTETTVVTLPPALAPSVTAPATDNNGAYTVSWGSVAATTDYQLHQRKNGGSWSEVYSGTATSKALSGLTDGNYDYRARACNIAGCSAYSGIDTTVVTFPPASAPVVTAPATDGDGGFTVSWTSVTSATEYRLEQRKDSGAWTQVHAGTATSKTVSGLADGSYGYRARACNAGGCSAYSAIDTTVVTHSPASAPTVSAPSSDTDGAFTIAWTSVASTTEYRLEQRKDGGSWTQVYSGSGTSKAVSGLGNGTYDYRARACNAGGCGVYSATDSTVVLLAPASAPAVTTPSADNNGAYTLTWSSVATATEYRLEQRKDGSSWSQIHAGAATSKSVSGLTNGSYDYRARACNSSGCSGYSAIRTTLVTFPPSTAPSLTAPVSANTNQNYTVSWNAVDTATSYQLDLGGGGSWSNIYSGSALSRIQNHGFDGAYDYRVRACNVGGCGPYSATRRVQVVGGGGGGNCGGQPCPEPFRVELPGSGLEPVPAEGEGE